MNKTKLKAKAREILNKYPLESIVSDYSDRKFLTGIFENHPDWLQKKGPGIAYITISNKNIHRTRCFVLNRLDGSSTDISYIQSISPTNKYFDVKAACRAAVRSELLNFKRRNFVSGETLCSISKEVLTNDNVHIDHHNLSFHELYVNWLNTQDKDYILSKLSSTLTDNETDVWFLDESIASNFVNYHNANTTLRLVTRNVNLSLLKKK